MNLILIKENKGNKSVSRIMLEDLPCIIEKYGLPLTIESNQFKGVDPVEIFDNGLYDPLLAEYISSCEVAVVVKNREI